MCRRDWHLRGGLGHRPRRGERTAGAHSNIVPDGLPLPHRLGVALPQWLDVALSHRVTVAVSHRVPVADGLPLPHRVAVPYGLDLPHGDVVTHTQEVALPPPSALAPGLARPSEAAVRRNADRRAGCQRAD